MPDLDGFATDHSFTEVTSGPLFVRVRRHGPLLNRKYPNFEYDIFQNQDT